MAGDNQKPKPMIPIQARPAVSSPYRKSCVSRRVHELSRVRAKALSHINGEIADRRSKPTWAGPFLSGTCSSNFSKTEVSS